VDPTVREVLRASKLDALFEFAGDRAQSLLSARRQAPRAGDGEVTAPQATSPPERPPLAGRPAVTPLKRRRTDPKST
jgi:hypothetical protein